MSFVEVPMYRVVCDGKAGECGKSPQDDSEYYAWSDKDGAEIEAEGSDWRTIDGKHYCPDCYEYDEDADEYVPVKEAA